MKKINLLKWGLLSLFCALCSFTWAATETGTADSSVTGSWSGTVSAGTVLHTGTYITWSLAFADDWSSGGCSATFNINETDVASQGAVGNTNPVLGTGTQGYPTSGAVFKFEAKADGYLYILFKANTKRTYLVWEGEDRIPYSFACDEETYGNVLSYNLSTVATLADDGTIDDSYTIPAVKDLTNTSLEEDCQAAVIKFAVQNGKTYTFCGTSTKVGVGAYYFDQSGDATITYTKDGTTYTLLNSGVVAENTGSGSSEEEDDTVYESISTSTVCTFQGGEASNTTNFNFGKSGFSTSKGSVTIDGTEYTGCVKTNSDFTCSFTTAEANMVLTLIYLSSDTSEGIDLYKGEEKVGELTSDEGNNIITYTLEEAASYTLKKNDTAGEHYLFYISVALADDVEDGTGGGSTTATITEANWDWVTPNPSSITSNNFSEGTTGYLDSDVEGIQMYVDASNGGKLSNNGGNAQFNEGTILRVPVVNQGDKVTVKGYDNFGGLNYSIAGGATINAQTGTNPYEYEATEADVTNGFVEIESLGGFAYLYYVKVTYTTPITVDEITADLATTEDPGYGHFSVTTEPVYGDDNASLTGIKVSYDATGVTVNTDKLESIVIESVTTDEEDNETTTAVEVSITAETSETGYTLSLETPISDAGTYNYTLPEWLFSYGEGKYNSKEATGTATVVEAESEPDAVVLSNLTKSSDLEAETLDQITDEVSSVTVSVENLEQYSGAGIYFAITYTAEDEDGEYTATLTDDWLKADTNDNDEATGTYTWTCGYTRNLEKGVEYTFSITPKAQLNNKNSADIGEAISFKITGTYEAVTATMTTDLSTEDPITADGEAKTITLTFDKAVTVTSAIMNTGSAWSGNAITEDLTVEEKDEVATEWTITISADQMNEAAEYSYMTLVIYAEDENGTTVCDAENDNADNFSLYYDVESPLSWTFDPEDGSTVESLSTIVVSCDDGITYMDGDITITGVDSDGQPIDLDDVTITCADDTEDEDETATSCTITISPAITTEGTYTITIDEEAFYVAGETDSPETTLTYYVTSEVGSDTDDTTLTLDPADGSTVTSLSTITVSGKIAVNWSAGHTESEIIVTDENGNTVATVETDGIEDVYGDSYEYNDGETITLSTTITAAGTYTLTIPAGFFLVGEAQTEASAITATYTILSSDTDGINGITLKAGADDKFYNLNGQRVTSPRNGVFILNGKKVLIK